MRLHLFYSSIDWGSQEMTTFPMVKPPSSLLCLPSLPPSCLWFVTPRPFSLILKSSHISCFPSSLNTYLSIFTLYQFLPTLFPLFIEILNYLYLVWRIQRGNFGRRGILLTFLHVSIWTQIPCEVKWRTTSFSRMVLSWQAQTPPSSPPLGFSTDVCSQRATSEPTGNSYFSYLCFFYRGKMTKQIALKHSGRK